MNKVEFLWVCASYAGLLYALCVGHIIGSLTGTECVTPIGFAIAYSTVVFK